MGLPKLHVQGHVATIKLDRPDKANRIEPDDLSALAEHIASVNMMPEVLVLVIRSEGRYFCSGYDISRLQSDSKVSFEDVINAVEECRPVSIAVLHGGVYGGATDLALACDFRLGAKGIDTFMPAARLGLMFSVREMSRYLTRIGLDNTKRLFLTGERINAEDMRAMGFLTQLESCADLAQAVDTLVERLTGMAPLPLLAMKKHMNRAIRAELDIEALQDDIARTRLSADRIEGIAAWSEKRRPQFTGK